MFKSKISTIVLAALVVLLAVALILVPSFMKKQVVYDTNEGDLGKTTVNWIENYDGTVKKTGVERRPDAIGIKGEYRIDGSTIWLDQQETEDTDNYGVGYDLYYFDELQQDFSISADITVKDDKFNVYAKAGLKIAVDDQKYFSVFILPSTGEFCLLSTLNGGLNWIQIWPCYPIRGYELDQPTNLKLVRVGEVVEVYVNGELRHTEKEFKMGADTPVMVGLTSEAVGPVVYENIVIEPVERTEEPVIEEPVVEETTGETLPGTVKGVYADAGAGICLQRQETTDNDNYAAGYDLLYFDGTYTDFTVSADVRVLDDEVNVFSKAGLKLAADDTRYYSVFVLPKDGQVTFLATTDGGKSWVEIWKRMDIPHWDAEGVTNLKVARNGETIEVYANGELVLTEEKPVFEADMPVKVGLTSEAVSPVLYENMVIETNGEIIPLTTAAGTVKGKYAADGSSVRLVEQATVDNDNYAAGYDLLYFDGAYTDVTVSADVRVVDDEINVFSKAGLKLAADETRYYSVFVLPKDGQVTFLSTTDGGKSWVEIWKRIDIPNWDAAGVTNLKVVRSGEAIEVYANGELVLAEEKQVFEADMPVKVGLTSEAVGPVVYENIAIEGIAAEIIPAVETPVEAVPEDEGKTESAEGTVKGTYTADGSTVILTEQATTDNDNYAAGYDLFYFDGTYGDVAISADIRVQDDEVNAFSKAGLKLAADDKQYYSIFVLPKDGQVTFLSTMDGGANWLEIWKRIDIPNWDAAGVTNLKLVRAGEGIEVYANGELVLTEDKPIFAADALVRVGLTSEAVGPVAYENITIEAAGEPEAKAETAEGTVKGFYVAEGTTVCLTEQATGDTDNYAAGYDLFYFDGLYGDVAVSADVRVQDDEVNAYSKAGLKLAVDDKQYYSIFVLPKDGQVTFLSTMDGGANWLEIWKRIDIPNWDAAGATNLKLVRIGEDIEVYANGELVLTEDKPIFAADAVIKVGLTSEAVGPVAYENILIEAVEKPAEEPVEEPVVEKTKPETAEGTVKGIYAAEGATVCLTEQATEDSDNYAAGYDLFYFDGTYSDVAASADVRVQDEEVNAYSKAGLKLAVDEKQYYSVFVLPKEGQVTFLSTMDGGASWLEIWKRIDIPNWDAAGETNLKVIRVGEGIEVYANGELILTEDKPIFATDAQVKVGLTSEAVGPVAYENILIEAVEKPAEEPVEEPVVEETKPETAEGTVKGIYAAEGTSVCLTEQATGDSDNYAAGYDLFYFDGTYGNVAVSADVRVQDDEVNAYSKAGLKLAADEKQYYSVFVLPKDGQVTFLSTMDGGASWLEIWKRIDIPNWDATGATNLKVVRVGEGIEVYANGELILSEDKPIFAADDSVKVGLTSEAVGPVAYENILIETVEEPVAEPVEEPAQEPVAEEVKPETAEGTVKGVYAAEGTTVCLTEQATGDTDNYAAGYDLFYFDGSYDNVSVSADVRVQDDEVNAYSKAGLKLAVDEKQYYSIFVLPRDGQVTFLSTMDGGASWLEIWKRIDIPSWDAAGTTNLKLVRVGEGIEVYANGEVVLTEDKPIFAADAVVKVGLTSEAVGPVAYENILIEAVEEPVAEPVEEPVEEPAAEEVKPESAAGTVKGYYIADGAAICLTEQATADSDNYAAGYDLLYCDGEYTDVSISADITLLDEEINVYSKAGLKIAADEKKYFSAFILPGAKQVTLLSTLEGGASWVQIWKSIDIPNYVDGGATALKLEKQGDTVLVYANGELLHTETGFVLDADALVKVGLTSEAVSPVKYENIAIEPIEKPAEEPAEEPVVEEVKPETAEGTVKGFYTAEGTTVCLTEQATGDADNYAAGYDLFYFDGTYGNVAVTADVRVQDEEVNAYSKAGLKLAVDEKQYYSVFVLPKDGQVTFLSTMDGGASWLEIWKRVDIPNLDAAGVTNLKLVRVGEGIEVYANGELVLTEDKPIFAADAVITIGLTSEAVGPVAYENILIETIEKTAEEPVEEPVVEEIKPETAEGTVKGIYAVDGTTVCLTEQVTEDADNYAAGYDLFYFDGTYGNVEVSADVRVQDEEVNAYSKAGLKLAADEKQYYSVFVLPKDGQVTFLSTMDGGASWLEIWKRIDIPNWDAAGATNLKVVRVGEGIEVYANGELILTEDKPIFAADAQIKVGLTSEAVGPVVYENIAIEAK